MVRASSANAHWVIYRKVVLRAPLGKAKESLDSSRVGNRLQVGGFGSGFRVEAQWYCTCYMPS